MNEVLPSMSLSDDTIKANVAGVSLAVDKKTVAGAWSVVRSWPAVVWLCLLGMLYSGGALWYLSERAFPQHIEQIMQPVKEQAAELKGAVSALREVAGEIKSERSEHAKERSEHNARMDKFMEKVFDSRGAVPLPNRDSTVGGGS